MAAIEVKVPDIGDFSDVPVIGIMVAAGDSVDKESPLIELESNKVSKGSLILTMEVEGAAADASSGGKAAPSA